MIKRQYEEVLHNLREREREREKQKLIILEVERCCNASSKKN
jgi:hypothetical protein